MDIIRVFTAAVIIDAFNVNKSVVLFFMGMETLSGQVYPAETSEPQKTNLDGIGDICCSSMFSCQGCEEF